MDHCVSQIQHNYLDTEYQAGTRGLQYAASKGLAVVIMEGLRGSALARDIPPAVQALWDGYLPPVATVGIEGGCTPTLPSPAAAGEGTPRTPADWALQWLWNQPEVSLVLSGMSTMEQACPRPRPGVEQNLESAGRSGVGTMTDEELSLMAQAREAYLSLMAIPCTACQYCLPCPQGVAIPDVLGAYNEAKMFGALDRASQFYGPALERSEGWIDDKARGDACIECGECLEKCPQGIDIPEWMKKVHEALAAKAA